MATISLTELTNEFGIDKLSKAAEALNLTLRDEYDENDPELEKLVDFVKTLSDSDAAEVDQTDAKTRKNEPQTIPTKKEKRTSSKLATQNEQSKGRLTAANQTFAKTAIKETAQQMAELADTEARLAIGTYLTRKTQNMQTLTEAIEAYGASTREDLVGIEDELDIDELLGDVSDPLYLGV